MKLINSSTIYNHIQTNALRLVYMSLVLCVKSAVAWIHDANDRYSQVVFAPDHNIATLNSQLRREPSIPILMSERYKDFSQRHQDMYNAIKLFIVDIWGIFDSIGCDPHTNYPCWVQQDRYFSFFYQWKKGGQGKVFEFYNWQTTFWGSGGHIVITNIEQLKAIIEPDRSN